MPMNTESFPDKWGKKERLFFNLPPMKGPLPKKSILLSEKALSSIKRQTKRLLLKSGRSSISELLPSLAFTLSLTEKGSRDDAIASVREMILGCRNKKGM